EVRQRRGHLLGVLELAERLAAAVAHAPAGVHDDERLEVRLLLVLLDEEPVGLAVGPPVDVPQLVAGVVLAVLGELGTEPLERAAVDAGEEPLDDGPGDQRQAAVAGQLGGVEREHGGIVGRAERSEPRRANPERQRRGCLCKNPRAGAWGSPGAAPPHPTTPRPPRPPGPAPARPAAGPP